MSPYVKVLGYVGMVLDDFGSAGDFASVLVEDTMLAASRLKEFVKA